MGLLNPMRDKKSGKNRVGEWTTRVTWLVQKPEGESVRKKLGLEYAFR